jgi:hypothetical protein
MINLSSINNTIGQLDSLLGSVKEKLLNNPEQASVKLADVLGELGKILDYMEKEIVEYLSLNFNDDKSNFVVNRSKLLSFESGFTMIKANEARGHCHKISNIHEKYLSTWFSKHLDPADTAKFKMLFDSMNYADGDMIQAINELSGYLMFQSELVLNILDTDNIQGANQIIIQARLDVQQDRRDLVNSLSRLKLLQASFIASSEVV